MASPSKQPIPLYSPLGTRDSTINQDSRLVNGYAEQDMDGQRGEVWVYKRPGLLLSSTVAAGQTGRGVYNWNGDIFSVFGNTLYKNGVAKGTVDATSSYRFTSCLGATPRLFLKNRSAAYYYDDGGGLVQVIDPDYPATTVPGCAYLDGTIYVMNSTAHIDGSGLNDPSSWDPLNTLVAQIEPDMAMFLAKQLVYVIAIKTISTEVFFDAGNPSGSPLGPVQGSKMGFGARSSESVAQLGDDLAWVSQTNEGGISVVFLSKTHGETISTPPVERFLGGLSFNTVYAWSAHISGHRLYVVTFKESDTTIVFDITSNAWYLWASPTGGYMPIVSSTFTSSSQTLLQGESDGNLYVLDANTYADNGVPFKVSIFTPNYDGGLRSIKTCSYFNIVADQVDTDVNVSWSDDDYQTFCSPFSLNLNQLSPKQQDGSSFYKRAWQITHIDNTPLRIKALNIMTAAGDN